MENGKKDMVMIQTDNPLNKDENSPLYQKNELVNDFVNRSGELADMMEAAIIKHNAYGVAANQLGINEQAFMYKVKDEFVAVFNPRILTYSVEKAYLMEGCLSFPGLFVKIERPVSITVDYNDEDGKVVEAKLHGMEARVFQHEFDHLQGLRFFDKAKRIHRDAAFRKHKQWKRKNP